MAQIEGLRRERGSLAKQVGDLQVENKLLEKHNRGFGEWVVELQQTLIAMRAREHTATKQQDIEPHEAISAQFESVFQRCEDWARRYFRIEIRDFPVEEFPLFAREVKLVLWKGVNWKYKKCFRVSHLVQAVLGNLLVRKIFECPFLGCVSDFRREFRNLYEIKLKGIMELINHWLMVFPELTGTTVEGEPAAHRWRASSLTA
jgi:hypothetical protein